MLSLKTIYSSIFFGFLLIVYFSIFSGFGKKPPSEWVEREIEWNGRCGTESRIGVGQKNQGKSVKKIALMVTLTKSDHDMNCRTWDTYQRVAKISLEKFEKTNPTYSAEIVYFNDISDMDDRKVSEEKIKNAKAQGVLIVIGNPWSTLAAMDSEQANLHQIPYISPTAVVASVHDSPWSISLGVDVRKSAKGFPGFLKKIKRDKLFILECKEKIQEREYADAVRKEVKNARTIQFYDEISIDKVENEIKNHSDSVVFLPGYNHSHSIVSKLFKIFPNLVFIVSSHWTHDYTPLVQEFKNTFGLSLYAFSDFISTDRPAAQFLQDAWAKSGGHPFAGGLRYSLFDTITLALHALNDPKINTREEAIFSIKNMGMHPDSSKTSIEIRNGNVIKPIYIAKWEQDRFVKIDEFIP